MEKILIERFDNDPDGALGRVAAESGRWEVLIDKDNCPHLYIQCNVESDDGAKVKGMLCVDDLLHADLQIADLMHPESCFGGKCSPEDEEEAAREWGERHTKQGIPCPGSRA